jgi:hypothetical protein
MHTDPWILTLVTGTDGTARAIADIRLLTLSPDMLCYNTTENDDVLMQNLCAVIPTMHASMPGDGAETASPPTSVRPGLDDKVKPLLKRVVSYSQAQPRLGNDQPLKP